MKNQSNQPVIVDEELCIGLSNEEIAAMAAELREFREQEEAGLPLTPLQQRRRVEINSTVLYNDKFRYFAYPYIKNSFPTYWAENGEEMMQSAFAEFFENFPKYNGSCAISTFAKIHLHHGAQVFISFFEKKGSYDNENWIKVSRTQARLIAQHLYDTVDDIPIAKLAQETGLSTAQVSALLEVHKGATHCDLETGAASVATKQWVPELVMEQKESDEAVARMLGALPRLERFVLTAKLGLNSDKLSFQEIGLLPSFIKLIREEGFSYLIKDGKVKVKKHEVAGEFVPSKDVIDFYEQAKLHLRQCSDVQQKLNKIKGRIGKEAAGITSYSKIVEQDEFAVMQILENPDSEVVIVRN